MAKNPIQLLWVLSQQRQPQVLGVTATTMYYVWTWGVCSVPGFRDTWLWEENSSPSPLLALVRLRNKVQNFTCVVSSTSKTEAKTDISIQAVEKNGLEWCLLSRTIPFRMGWGEISGLEGLLPCTAALVFAGPWESGGLCKKRIRKSFSECDQTVSHTPPVAL